MAYTNVKKPAFYIPVWDWLHSLGWIGWDVDDDYIELLRDVHLLNPSNRHKWQMDESDEDWYLTEEKVLNITLRHDYTMQYQAIADENNKVYLFILGHNFRSTEISMELQIVDAESSAVISPSHTSIVNSQGGFQQPDYNGYTIMELEFSGVDTFNEMRLIFRGHGANASGFIKLGSVSLCSKWTPPHNPDLTIKMDREFDGVKTKMTKGGATLSNAQYTRGPFWVTAHPWQLSSGDYEESDNPVSKTLGRRTWNMNFSYLSPEDIMPKIEDPNYYESADLVDNDDTIINSQSFFARVLNRVQGSHLPFIFNINDTDATNNSDQWAICRFDQKKFPISQKAPELYSMKLKIKESW